MTEQNELVVIKPANIPALFQKDGCDPIIEGLKKEAAKFKGDVTTAKGRKEIASFARRFSTAKVYLDGLGKALSDELRDKIAPINGERNKIETCCNELRDEVRKPLTDWEDAEKERVADIEARIQDIKDYLDSDLIPFVTSEAVKQAIDKIKMIVVDDSFDEFELAATKAKATVLEQLEAKFIVLQNAEKEKAEAERLEKERLEKEQKEREEKIAKEAAEQATKDAEENAAKEAEEKERKEKEERERLEKEKLQLQLGKEKAEREKKEAEDRAKQEKKEAAEQAEKEQREAVEKEKQRQADQIKADEEADEKRQANKRHRNKIHKEAKASMLENGISEEDATIFVTMVKDGLVKHIKIDY